MPSAHGQWDKLEQTHLNRKEMLERLFGCSVPNNHREIEQAAAAQNQIARFVEGRHIQDGLSVDENQVLFKKCGHA